MIRASTLIVLAVLLLYGLTITVLGSRIISAHQDESIHYISSDGGTYYSLYENVFALSELSDSPVLFLVGTPILFTKLADGDIVKVLFLNMFIMALALKRGLDCFSRRRTKLIFLVAALMFPYFCFGPLSLNKEIYAMSAAILFCSYYIKGNFWDLVAALILAAFARYYMLAALLAMVFLFPVGRPPRIKLVYFMLLAISFLAPIAKDSVPEYSREDVLEVSGFTGHLMSAMIDNFGYLVAYPIKYILLIPQRAYSLMIDPGRLGNMMEAVVSVLSVAVLLLAVRRVFSRRPCAAQARRLIVLGMVAPIPMMWSDIMHWRYFSFVYFFFLIGYLLAKETSLLRIWAR